MEYNLKFHLDKDLPKPTKLKQDYLIEQVKYLATIPQHEQKSAEWYAMRQTMLSASDWGTILGVSQLSTSQTISLIILLAGICLHAYMSFGAGRKLQLSSENCKVVPTK